MRLSSRAESKDLSHILFESEVMVNRIGHIVILMPKDDPWAPMLQGLEMFTDDFLKDGIDDLPLQERPSI